MIDDALKEALADACQWKDGDPIANVSMEIWADRWVDKFKAALAERGLIVVPETLERNHKTDTDHSTLREVVARLRKIPMDVDHNFTSEATEAQADNAGEKSSFLEAIPTFCADCLAKLPDVVAAEAAIDEAKREGTVSLADMKRELAAAEEAYRPFRVPGRELLFGVIPDPDLMEIPKFLQHNDNSEGSE